MKSEHLMAALLLITATAWPTEGASARRHMIHEFDVAGWHGMAYADDRGEMTHCVVAAEFKSRLWLSFMMNADTSLHMQLVDERWDLPIGESFPVRLSLDGRSLGPHEAKVKSRNAVEISIGDADVAASLKVSRRLDVQAHQQTFSFDLAGSAKALVALRDCVARRDASPPALNTSAAGPRAADRDDQAFAGKVLQIAGHTDYSFADMAGSKHGLVGWDGADYNGEISVIESAKKPADFLAGLLVRLAKVCSGTVSTVTQPPRIGQDAEIHDAIVECAADVDGERWLSAIVVTRLAELQGSYVVLSDRTLGSSSEASRKSVIGFAGAVAVALNIP